MKSDLSFLAYLVTHFASHASCAPQGMDGDGFFVSSGQSCNVPVGIKGRYLTALGDIKTSCDGLAFDPRSYSTTSEHREMRCWFKKECSTKNGSGLCLNKECLSEPQQKNWSQYTPCPQSKFGVGCYVESPSTGKSLDKQAFSSENVDSFIVADSTSPPPSLQVAGLPVVFDSSSTAATPEADYLLQSNLGETDYPLNNNVEQAQGLLPNMGISAPSFDAWAMPRFVG